MLFAKYTRPNAGYPEEREQVKKMLTLDAMYPVDYISMGQSFTTVYLIGFDNYGFNSVNFTFYEDGKRVDIYSDARYNPYL